MRSLLLLWPKPPAIKPPFALNRNGDRLGGKVTSSSSHNGNTWTATELVKKLNVGQGKKVRWVSGQQRAGRRERKSDKSAAHERRQCVIYVSTERSGNWE